MSVRGGGGGGGVGLTCISMTLIVRLVPMMPGLTWERKGSTKREGASECDA